METVTYCNRIANPAFDLGDGNRKPISIDFQLRIKIVTPLVRKYAWLASGVAFAILMAGGNWGGLSVLLLLSLSPPS